MCRFHHTLLPNRQLYYMYKARGLVPCHPPDLVARLDRLARDRPSDRLEKHRCHRLDPWVLGHLNRWVLYHRLDLQVLWETHQGVRLVPCHRVVQLDLDHLRRPVQSGLAGLDYRFRLNPLHRYRRLDQWWALGRCSRLGLDLYQVRRSVRLDPWDRFALLLEGPWRHCLCWLDLCPQWDRRVRLDQLDQWVRQCQLARFDQLARLDQWWLCRLVQ